MDALQYSFNVIYRRKHDPDGERSLEFCEYLVRLLEGKGLKGYYADRDAMIGSNIFDEAFQVITSSRFTIVILSPKFVRDNWNLYWQQAAFRILAERGREESRTFLPISLGVDEDTIERYCQNLCLKEVLYVPANYEGNTSGGWKRKIISAVVSNVPVSQLQGPRFVESRQPDGEGPCGMDMQNGACAGIGRDQSPPGSSPQTLSPRSIARPLPATVQGPPSGNPRFGSTSRSSARQDRGGQVRGPGDQLLASQSSLEVDSPTLDSLPVVSLHDYCSEVADSHTSSDRHLSSSPILVDLSDTVAHGEDCSEVADSYTSERHLSSSPIFVDLPDTVAHGDDSDETIPKSTMYTISDSPPQTRTSAADMGTEDDDNLECEIMPQSLPPAYLSGLELDSTAIGQRPVENIIDREEYVDHTRAATAVKQSVPLADMFEPLAGPVDQTDRGTIPKVSPESGLSLNDPPADATTEHHHHPVENASVTDRDDHPSDSRAATAGQLLDRPAELLDPPTEADRKEIASLGTNPSPGDYHPVGNDADHAEDTIAATATLTVTATHCQPSWYGWPTWRGLKNVAPFVILKFVESVLC